MDFYLLINTKYNKYLVYYIILSLYQVYKLTMKAIEIQNKESFIKYLNQNDIVNLDKYLNLVEFYNKNSIHNVYKICSYIFNQIENKDISNKYNYFSVAFINNIKKLDEYLINSKENNNISWLNKEIKSTIATKEEQEEIKNMLFGDK